MSKYNAWKAKSNGEPIEDTDRILEAPTHRWVIKHLANEEGVAHKHNDVIVRLPNGDFWCASKVGK